MTIEEFEQYLTATGHVIEHANGADGQYTIIKSVPITAGSQAGNSCDVGILGAATNPWVPQSAVHVRPHLVQMGQVSSQASNLGPDWQYLSRRFDRSPTPKGFLAHILTVLSQL